jgi:hypothetical protein
MVFTVRDIDQAVFLDREEALCYKRRSTVIVYEK